MDFTTDTLADGRNFRTLNIVDDFTRERDECLNEHWFVSLVDAKAVIEAWLLDYNTVRPHSSLAGRTPAQFAAMTEGARRLTPARPAQDPKPEDLSLPV